MADDEAWRIDMTIATTAPLLPTLKHERLAQNGIMSTSARLQWPDGSMDVPVHCVAG